MNTDSLSTSLRIREYTTIEPKDLRLRSWNNKPMRSSTNADYVVYWCQATRRAVDNLALEYAIEQANQLHLPLVVYESLRTDYAYANDRIHRFILECAHDSAAHYKRRGLSHLFFLPTHKEQAHRVAAKVFARAALVVSDENPTFLFPQQNAAASYHAPCAYVTIDDQAIVPMRAIPSHESQARTIRPKIMRVMNQYLGPVCEVNPKYQLKSNDWPFDPIDCTQLNRDAAIAQCSINHSIKPVHDRRGGSTAAYEQLHSFVQTMAGRYHETRDDALDDHNTSNLSAYLHFGAISARACVLAVLENKIPVEARNAWIEQLVVRRGLAFNHAYHEPNHAHYESIPAWARQTLAEHANDARPTRCEQSALEVAKSKEPLWNAAQRELILFGRMPNVLRMYWGKQLLRMIADPKEAFEFGIRMFNQYSLDGRDPNTYTGVGWCFGLHDQPFPERAIFGKVRPMGLGAIEKRFKPERYIQKVETMCQLGIL